MLLPSAHWVRFKFAIVTATLALLLAPFPAGAIGDTAGAKLFTVDGNDDEINDWGAAGMGKDDVPFQFAVDGGMVDGIIRSVPIEDLDKTALQMAKGEGNTECVKVLSEAAVVAAAAAEGGAGAGGASSGAAAAAEDAPLLGQRVVLGGLSSRPELNGRFLFL